MSRQNRIQIIVDRDGDNCYDNSECVVGDSDDRASKPSDVNNNTTDAGSRNEKRGDKINVVIGSPPPAVADANPERAMRSKFLVTKLSASEQQSINNVAGLRSVSNVLLIES